MLFPSLACSLPYTVLAFILHATNTTLTSTHLLLAPRLFMFLASLLVDACLYRVCVRTGFDCRGALLFASTSWAMLTFSYRPFSNSLELVVLSVLVWMLVDWRPPYLSGWRNFAFGLVAAVGVFVRVTFSVLLLPCAVYLLVDCKNLLVFNIERLLEARRTTRHMPLEERLFGYNPMQGRTLVQAMRLSKKQSFVRYARVVLEVIFGCMLVGFTCVLFDSLYFGSLVVIHDQRKVSLTEMSWTWEFLSSSGIYGSFTATPLNNLLYNMDANNLAQHGTHWRGTHVAVNVPLLFGPMTLIALFKLAWGRREKLNEIIHELGINLYFTPDEEKRRRHGVLPHYVMIFMASLVVLYLVALSWVPHQEARFLLPLVFPLALLCGYKLVSGRYCRYYFALWVACNAALTVFMGQWHQGGVLPVLSHLQETHVAPLLDTPDSHRVDLFFYHTYMPPESLLAFPNDAQARSRLVVHDEQGAVLHLFEQMRTVARGGEVDSTGSSTTLHTTSYAKHDIYLIVPASVEIDVRGGLDMRKLELDFESHPHLSLEHLPPGPLLSQVWEQMTLKVYKYTDKPPRASVSTSR